ncbi:CARDB domain-containing protein [Actinomyces trachealis]|uniref:CARDB domain-containing protein n=1 Tax=Actinomyces trachealis TaxID=2763540 RepID=UPI001892A94E|nr:CARDB domain-containing protein [Actinomyces trachealis]
MKPMRTAAVLLVLPMTVTLMLGGCSKSDKPSVTEPTASAAATDSAATSMATSPAPTSTPLGQATDGATQDPATGQGSTASSDPASSGGDLSEESRRMPAAPIEQPAVMDSGVTVALGALSSTDLKSELPGEVAGPGVLVPVTVTNPGTEAISLESLVVNCYYGEDNQEAAPNPSSSEQAPASLEAGESTTVTFAFRVPVEGRGHMRVVVDLSASEKTAVFEGAGPVG